MTTKRITATLPKSAKSASPKAAAAPRSAPANAVAEPRVALPGSQRGALPGADIAAAGGASSRSRSMTVSVLLRRRQTIAPKALGRTILSRAQFRTQYSADPAAVKAVKAFARQFNLTVETTPEQLDAATLKLSGTRAELEQAFGVTLTNQKHGAHTYRIREGEIYIPASLSGLVLAVLGLDDRPQAKPHFRIARDAWPQLPVAAPTTSGGDIIPAAAGSSSFTPPQIAQLYGFPANASAAGQTIGLIELGGGFRPADIKAYFKSLGIPAPTVVAVPVDGGKNAPSTPDGADGEVMLDIEVAAAVAPGVKIAVYFAPNTDQGFLDALTTAVHDRTNKPSVVSISWGGPESSWTQQALTAFDSACQAAALLGVSITTASGDNGSADGVTDGADHVDFPASSPHVLACGGTKIAATGTSLSSEVVWNELSANQGATGGGVSAIFAKPSWQAAANVPAPSAKTGGRGVPDVSGNADPVTGYTVRVDGQTFAIGGTSAVAPLWAGLIALANKANGKPAGFLNPILYGARVAKSAFRDITQGNNGAFKAAPGWDACTGLGSPVGTAIITALGGGTSATGRRKLNPAPVRAVKGTKRTGAATA